MYYDILCVRSSRNRYFSSAKATAAPTESHSGLMRFLRDRLLPRSANRSSQKPLQKLDVLDVRLLLFLRAPSSCDTAAFEKLQKIRFAVADRATGCAAAERLSLIYGVRTQYAKTCMINIHVHT
jgi:hypothetical protein